MSVTAIPKCRTLYESEVTEVGKDVYELLESGLIILFCNEAPEMLREVSVCHLHKKPPHYNFRPGDLIIIGENMFTIEKVGEHAMRTFKSLGHFTLRVRQLNQSNLRPGDVLVRMDQTPHFQEHQSIKVLRPIE